MDAGLVTAYKVVRRTEQGTLVSCLMDHPELLVEYKPGEWAEAPVGGLLAFWSWASADGFAQGLHAMTHEQYEVWESEAEEPVRLPDLRVACTDMVNAVKWLWRHPCLQPVADEIRLGGFGSWPTGTQAFKRVRLLKRCGK